MTALIKYHSHLYFKSGRFTLPFAVWTVMLALVCHDSTSTIWGSMFLLVSVLYVCMTVVGYLYMDAEKHEMAADQVMIFHTKSMGRYHLSRCVFLFLLSFMMGIYGGVFAFLLYVMRTESRTATVTLPDWLLILVVLCLCACAGVMQGALLHPRIVRDRNVSMILLVGAVLLTFTKLSVTDKLGAAGVAVQWLFPPLGEIMQYFGGINERNIVLLLCWLAAYDIVLLVLECTLLGKKGY